MVIVLGAFVIRIGKVLIAVNVIKRPYVIIMVLQLIRHSVMHVIVLEVGAIISAPIALTTVTLMAVLLRAVLRANVMVITLQTVIVQLVHLLAMVPILANTLLNPSQIVRSVNAIPLILDYLEISAKIVISVLSLNVVLMPSLH